MASSSHPAQGPAPGAAGLRVRDISKSFPGTRALDRVSFEVAGGAFGALLGGNGSGKSTLIKILAGVVPGDPGGRIDVGEHSVASDENSPGWARDAGVAFVHQDLGLFEPLSVAENIFEGAPYPQRFGRVRWGALVREAQGILDELDIALDARRSLGRLRASDRTLVAIARALRGRAGRRDGVLVLDEPTARLPADEVELLLEALRGHAARGQTILYVSHRLDEVLGIADQVTVLRDGRLVASRPRDEVDERELVRLIVGRDLDGTRRRASRAPAGAPVVLDVRELAGGPLRGVGLELRAGEIVGVAGLVGSGRTTLLEMIAGARRPAAGTVHAGGAPLRPGDVAAAVAAGVVYVPEDRAADGAFLALGLTENVSAGDLSRYWRGLRLRHRDERRDAQHAVDRFSIRTASVSAPLATLSGGNQQKAVLARWLGCTPKVLLLDEPTQGVDIGARTDIYAHLRQAADGGVAILLASSDIEELLGLADRIVVIAGGRVAEHHDAAALDRHVLAERVHLDAAGRA